MHLTNYSINKHNENFDQDDSDDSGSKRYWIYQFFLHLFLAWLCAQFCLQEYFIDISI